MGKHSKNIGVYYVVLKESFPLVESESFRAFIRVLNKHVPHISRGTVVRDIEEEHAKRLLMVKEVMRKVSSNIAINYDGWSSRVLRGYFVVTAHWIMVEFELKKIVLNFVYFPAPQIMHKFEIEKKVTSVTTDNGSEMPPAMEGV